MEVLLTNDDGYASPGLHAIADALSDAATVTILAPAEDQSSVGRRRSDHVSLDARPNGYVIDGTPADCVIVGLEALDLSPDLVLAGCNVGANLGAYALGRSGTISAAVEAAFFDVPAIALSLYVPDDRWPLTPTRDHFDEATQVAKYLVPRAVDTGVFDESGYLNVNVPLEAEPPAKMRVTTPSGKHGLTAKHESDRVEILDRTWRRMADEEWNEAETTDRGAVMRGWISVSPLSAPHQIAEIDALESLVGGYEDAASQD